MVIQQLIHLEEAEPGAPISMHIMSGGGKVTVALALTLALALTPTLTLTLTLN